MDVIVDVFAIVALGLGVIVLSIVIVLQSATHRKILARRKSQDAPSRGGEALSKDLDD